jgi:CubicO group peptidase (beta-lactamase class C family)
VNGVVRPIAPFLSDNTNPAGGINSSAEDMAKWVRVLLAEGALRAAAVLPATWRRLTTLVTPLRSDRGARTGLIRPNFGGYALVGVRERREDADARGGLPAVACRWLPEETRVVVLTGRSRAGVRLCRQFRGGPLPARPAWSGWTPTRRCGRGSGRRSTKPAEGPRGAGCGFKPSPAASYAGTYRDGSAWHRSGERPKL